MGTLMEAVEGLKESMMHADRDALDRITADELSYGHASGVIEDKPAFIDAIVEERTVYRSITLSDHAVIECGTVAIVRHRFEADVVIQGTLVHSDVRVMQVWQMEDGWKLLARQAFKV